MKRVTNILFFSLLTAILIISSTGCKKELAESEKRSCSNDSDCDGDKICNNGVCADKTSCSNDSDCGDNEVCNQDTGKCEVKSECTFDSDCDSGFVCVDYSCKKAGCQSDSDCDSGKVCDLNMGECIDDTTFRVIYAYPEDGAVGVDQNITLKLKFNKPVDKQFVIDNLDNEGSPVLFLLPTWDPSGTIKFEENNTLITYTVNLESDKAYAFGTLSMKSADGDTLEDPFITYFYTGDNPPQSYVSGKVVVGSMEDYGPDRTILLLMDGFNDDPPRNVVFSSNDGTFKMPWVSPGRYFIMAMKDVDGDGQIEMDDNHSKDAIGLNGDRVMKFFEVGSDPVEGEVVTLYSPRVGQSPYSINDEPAIVASIMGNKTEITLWNSDIGEIVDDATVKVNNVVLEFEPDDPACQGQGCWGKYVDAQEQLEYASGATYELNITTQDGTVISNIVEQTMPANFTVDTVGGCQVGEPLTFQWDKPDNVEFYYVLIMDQNNELVYPTQNELDAIMTSDTTELTVDGSAFQSAGQYLMILNAINLGYGNVFTGNLINAENSLMVSRMNLYPFSCN